MKNLARQTLEYLVSRKGNLDSQCRIKEDLAQRVKALGDNPITDARPLERIICGHLIDPVNRKRYDYLKVVTSEQYDRLLALNTILATLDENFVIDTREFGIRGKKAIEYWDKICGYKEVYDGLSDIILLEDAYVPFTWDEARKIIRSLDDSKRKSPAVREKQAFDTHISREQWYVAIMHEIIVYMGDVAYDNVFKGEAADGYAAKYLDDIGKFHFKDIRHDVISMEDIDEIMNLAEKGRKVFAGEIA